MIHNNDNYTVLSINKIAKAFWSLNNEMNPANKVTFIREIDATAMDILRTTLLDKYEIKPSYTALVIKAAALSLQEFSYANRAIIGLPFLSRLVQFNHFNITVAVERSVPEAESVVLADTINDVISKSIADINKELKGMADATVETNPRWHLFSSLLSSLPAFLSGWIIRLPRYFPKIWSKHRGGACFVNSPAKYGIDLIVADMLWPLTVSFGWIKERPIVISGELKVRKTMPLTIIFDRRIMAGAPAARFFNRLAQILENADTEMAMGKTEISRS